ncbi:carbohydrate kinase family protein [Pseudolysinimonas sp.]|jgi:sugar/nucleoside kinase (ribokinase family)|uniref:carbohydrate kinase family protein n=1 Tax=Pseudolysinimonas sp. TaxID=2680009 RepID=UPI003784448A
MTTEPRRIVVVGDVMNDIVVVPRGAIRGDTDTDARIQPRPGGSAANTAAWAGSLGAAVDFLGTVGSADADYHAEALRNCGVEPHLHVEPGMPTGTIVLIIEGQSRSMLTDRGANAALRDALLTDAVLDAAGVVHVSGYTITKDYGRGAPRAMIAHARDRGIPVSVDPASTGYLADYGVERFLEEMRGVDIVFPNAAEGALLSGETDPQRIGTVLLERFPMVVLKQGAAGAILFRRGVPALAVAAPRIDNFVDPTGAGDAFAAGFLARWIRDGDAEASVRDAVGAAARAVMLIGGRPPV